MMHLYPFTAAARARPIPVNNYVVSVNTTVEIILVKF